MLTALSLRPRSRRIGSQISWVTSLAMLACLVAGCGLLDVSDPTLVQDGDLANEAGANARRLSVVAQVNAMGALIRDVALFTDERALDALFPQDRSGSLWLDARDGQRYEAEAGNSIDPHLGPLDMIVTRSSLAIPAVRAYTPDSLRGEFLAQLFALRGYAIIQMAEDVCPGFPINDVKDNLPVYSDPFTTDSALTYGITQLDSALVHGQDSLRFLNLAQVVKGRALIDLGRYPEAAATVAAVPTEFAYPTDQVNNGGLFVDPGQWTSTPEAVGNIEGGTGLPFVSAQDPRVLTAFVQTRFDNPADSLYDQLKYPASDTPIVLASGIEARLIQAEAALSAGDANWLTILNTLRTTAITPALATIDTMPATPAAQVDLLYSERAFWLYLTGRRLGDVRRLIRNYARAPETVLPTGVYPLGSVYGTATAIPFVQANEQQFNPHITSGCTTR